MIGRQAWNGITIGMTNTPNGFRFGESPYDWDEFTRFIDWWAGPKQATADPTEEQRRLLGLAEPLDRYFRDIGVRSLSTWDDIYLPKPEEQHHGDLLVFGQQAMGGGPLAADLEDPDLAVYSVVWGSAADPRDWWEWYYPSLQEALIKMTLHGIVGHPAPEATFNLGLDPHPRRPSESPMTPEQFVAEATFLLDVAAPRNQPNDVRRLHLLDDTLALSFSEAPERERCLLALLRPDRSATTATD